MASATQNVDAALTAQRLQAFKNEDTYKFAPRHVQGWVNTAATYVDSIASKEHPSFGSDVQENEFLHDHLHAVRAG